MAAVEHISEAWPQPRLEDMMAQFPFPILGFHTDNGSEFIDRNVAGMLNKLNVDQTKSRPGHSSDSGLAETKTAESSASISDWITLRRKTRRVYKVYATPLESC